MDEIIKHRAEFHNLYDQMMSHPPPVYERNPLLKKFELWWKLMPLVKQLNKSSSMNQPVDCETNKPSDRLENDKSNEDNVTSGTDLSCEVLMIDQSNASDTPSFESVRSINFDGITKMSNIKGIEVDEDTILLRRLLMGESEKIDSNDRHAGSELVDARESFEANEIDEIYLLDNDKENESGHDMTIASFISQRNANLKLDKEDLKEKIAEVRKEYLANLVQVEIENIKLNAMRELFKAEATKGCREENVVTRRTESLEHRIERYNELERIVRDEKDKESKAEKQYKHLRAILRQTREKFKALNVTVERERSKIPNLLENYRAREQIVKEHRETVKSLRKELGDILAVEEATKKELKKEQSNLKKPLKELTRLEYKKRKLQESRRRGSDTACHLGTNKSVQNNY